MNANNNQHLEEAHEEDFLNDLLLEAGFDPEERKNYGIEKLWSDKPFVQVEDIL